MAAKIKELIKATTIARVTDKITGKFLGFLVKSNHTNEFYQVTCTKIAGEVLWNCTCEAGQHGFANCKPDADGNKYCCHIRACQQVCAARKQLNAERKEQERADQEILHSLDARPYPRFSKYSIAMTDYHPDFNQPKREESLVERAERQRKEAIKHGGFSLLKVA